MKYRRSAVEEKMPAEYAPILRELLFTDTTDPFRREFAERIIGHVADSEMVWDFVAGLCGLIQRV